MNDLVEFLRACIAEDEERARKRMKRAQETQLTLQDPWFLGRRVPGWHDWPDVEADTVRVVAKCAADRQIVEHHSRADDRWGPPECDGCRDGCLHCMGQHPWPCPTLRLIALPYADRPGYLEEWKP